MTVVPSSCRFYVDADGDGVGTGEATESTDCTTVPSGYSLFGNDCDDADSRVHSRARVDADGDGQCGTAMACTAAEQACALLSSDCNDQDASVSVTVYLDADGDGLGGRETLCVASEEASNYLRNGGDCDDSNPLLNYRFFWDEDGDGLYGEISQCGPWHGLPGERWYVEGLGRSDCDDSDPSIGQATLSPDADGDGLGASYRTCDGTLDNTRDCDDADGAVGERAYADLDGDGHGGGQGECRPLFIGYALGYSDCDDADPDVWRAGFRDDDGDGYGAGDWSCGGDALVSDSTDCDDNNPDANRMGYVDSDGDGYGDGERLCGDDTLIESSGDCDDTDASVYSWVYADADGDGLGSGEAFCSAPGPDNSLEATDCDDALPNGLFSGACDDELSVDGAQVPVVDSPCADLPTLVLSVSDDGCSSVVFMVTNAGVVPFQGTLELTRRRLYDGELKTSLYPLELEPGASVPLMHQWAFFADGTIVAPDVELCGRSVTHASVQSELCSD